MKRHAIFILICFLISPIFSPAFAQAPAAATPKKECTPVPPPEDPKKSPSLQRNYQRRYEETAAFDKNCDGILQPDELKESTAAKFKAADLNKDGILQPGESQAMVDNFKKSGATEYGNLTDIKAQRLETRLKKIDANNDGTISAEEYDAYYYERYNKLDKDKDGSLNIKEYETDVESHKHRNKPNH